MKLYLHPHSPNCVKVLFGASLMGLRLDFEIVDLPRGAHREPSFLRLNPNGKVPVLVDGDFVLWESHAILQYLAERAGESASRLWPTHARQRANIERWMCWTLTELSPAVRPFVWERLFKPRMTGGAPDPAVLAAAAIPLRGALQVLDAALAAAAHVAGDSLTLADVSIASALMYAEPAQLPMEPFSNVRRWLASVQAVPAWSAAQSAPSAA